LLGAVLIVNVGEVGQNTGTLGAGNGSFFHVIGDHSDGKLSGIQGILNVFLDIISKAVLKSKGQQVRGSLFLLEVGSEPVLEHVLLLSLITILEDGHELISVNNAVSERDASKSINGKLSDLIELLFFTEFAFFVVFRAHADDVLGCTLDVDNGLAGLVV
jgi:hypothetical protein